MNPKFSVKRGNNEKSKCTSTPTPHAPNSNPLPLHNTTQQHSEPYHIPIKSPNRTSLPHSNPMKNQRPTTPSPPNTKIPKPHCNKTTINNKKIPHNITQPHQKPSKFMPKIQHNLKSLPITPKLKLSKLKHNKELDINNNTNITCPELPTPKPQTKD